jgi:hypothetical protein
VDDAERQDLAMDLHSFKDCVLMVDSSISRSTELVVPIDYRYSIARTWCRLMEQIFLRSPACVREMKWNVID